MKWQAVKDLIWEIYDHRILHAPEINGTINTSYMTLNEHLLVFMMEKHKNRPATEKGLVEFLDGHHFVLGHVGYFFDRGEAFLHQDSGDFLIDIQQVHKDFLRFLNFSLALLLGSDLGHDVQIPTGELACQPDILAVAPDSLRQLLLGDRHIHAAGVFIDQNGHHIGW